MPPIRTGVDRAESRPPPSPLSRSSRSNGDDAEHESDENPESRWKRLYLEEQRKCLDTKKQRNDNTTTIKRLGRGIPKIVCLFGDIRDIIDDADKHGLRLEGELNDAELDDLDEAESVVIKLQQARSYRAFKVLERLIPNLLKTIDNSDIDGLTMFYAQLQEGATGARGEDIARLKVAVAAWLNAAFPNSPRLDPDDRSGRGIRHDITGRLLCPIKYDWDNDDVREKLRAFSPEYNYTGDFLLRCFYLNFKGEVRRPEMGFLKSSLLVKTFKHIFTSPASAKEVSILVPEAENDINQLNMTRRVPKHKKPARKSVAATLRMSKVTPRALAYAATQLAFALCNAESWCLEHNGCDFQSLYETIVDYFEVVENPVKRAERETLLEWWNRQIFPNAKTTHAAADARSETLNLLNGN